MTTSHTCLVCGWSGLENEPVFPFNSHEICSCCGTEYGLDVQEEGDVFQVRKEWLEEGAPWFDDEVDVSPGRPEGWSLERANRQIEKIKED